MSEIEWMNRVLQTRTPRERQQRIRELVEKEWRLSLMRKQVTWAKNVAETGSTDRSGIGGA